MLPWPEQFGFALPNSNKPTTTQKAVHNVEGLLWSFLYTQCQTQRCYTVNTQKVGYG